MRGDELPWRDSGLRWAGTVSKYLLPEVTVTASNRNPWLREQVFDSNVCTNRTGVRWVGWEGEGEGEGEKTPQKIFFDREFV